MDNWKYFHNKLHQFNGINLPMKTVNGWTMDEEPMMGTFYWFQTVSENLCVYATPYWEDTDGILVQVTNYDTEYIGEPVILPLPITGNIEADVETYFKVMGEYLAKLDMDK